MKWYRSAYPGSMFEVKQDAIDAGHSYVLASDFEAAVKQARREVIEYLEAGGKLKDCRYVFDIKPRPAPEPKCGCHVRFECDGSTCGCDCHKPPEPKRLERDDVRKLGEHLKRLGAATETVGKESVELCNFLKGMIDAENERRGKV